MRSYRPSALLLLVILSISCSKQGLEPVQLIPAQTHYFEAKCQLYGSTHYWREMPQYLEVL